MNQHQVNIIERLAWREGLTVGIALGLAIGICVVLLWT